MFTRFLLPLVCSLLLYSTAFLSLANAQDDLALDITITQESFAKETLRVLKKKYKDKDYTLDMDTFEINVSNKKDGSDAGHIYLGNLYNQAKYLDKSDRQDFLEDFLEDSSQAEFEQDPNRIKGNLLPRLRTPAEINNRQQYYGDKLETHTRAWGDLEIELVVESERAVASLTQSDLEKIEMDWDQAHKLAEKNLSDLPAQAWLEADGIFASSNYDDFDCARIVYNQDLPIGVKIEDVVAFFPSHSVCVLTDKPNPENLTDMIGYGQESAIDHRPLSYNLFVYRSGKWVVWRPEETHPGFKIVNRQTLIARSEDYSEQKYFLDRKFEENGTDIFVASLMALENDTGDVYSVSVILNDIEGWIPQADKYVFMQASGDSMEGKSEEIPLAEVEGLFKKAGITTVPNLVPVRYDLTGEARKRLDALTRRELTFSDIED